MLKKKVVRVDSTFCGCRREKTVLGKSKDVTRDHVKRNGIINKKNKRKIIGVHEKLCTLF